MSDGSGIEWTGATWNLVSGCTRASEGCDHCYAVQMTHRLGAMGAKTGFASHLKYAGLTVLNNRGDRHFNGEVRCDSSPELLARPIRWRDSRTIFVNSMSDTFHRDVPVRFIAELWAVMSVCYWHTFQVLTKRAERMAEVLTSDEFAELYAGYMGEWEAIAEEILGARGDFDVLDRRSDDFRAVVSDELPQRHIWLGVSAENQKRLDERAVHLARCPAAVRFLSLEPLLGDIDLTEVLTEPASLVLNILARHYRTPEGGGRDFDPEGKGLEYTRQVRDPLPIHWAILGCESRNGKSLGRFDTEGTPWTPEAQERFYERCRRVGSQCLSAGTALFVKQLPVGGRACGDIEKFPADLKVRQFPTTQGEQGCSRSPAATASPSSSATPPTPSAS